MKISYSVQAPSGISKLRDQINMANTLHQPLASVKVYHGYGHKDNLIIYGHVLAGKLPVRKKYSRNVLVNIIHLIKLFFIRPVANAKLMLNWEDQQLLTTSEKDGFFKFEWRSTSFIAAGWHSLTVNLLDARGLTTAKGEGKIFIPNSTQYAFISDVDDTVLVSYASTTYKRLKTLFTKNPRTRKTFADLVKHYHLLSLAHTDIDLPNPFFYVSSSEWNLYDDLKEFFRHNGLPEGVFLLNEIKRWYQLFKTGNTKHQGKLIRVARILDAFPHQKFILLGDNSQKDPEIYVSIANKYPEKIFGIYIRNILSTKQTATEEKLQSLHDKRIYTCLFNHTDEAIQYSKSIGLIDYDSK